MPGHMYSSYSPNIGSDAAMLSGFSYRRCPTEGEVSMYLIRRTYTVQPGQARRAATIIDTIGRAYEEAGIRSASRVYFNSGTTPGDKNTVVMEWTDETLRTPYRDDRAYAEGLDEFTAELRELAIDSVIEFWELMTDEKRMD